MCRQKFGPECRRSFRLGTRSLISSYTRSNSTGSRGLGISCLQGLRPPLEDPSPPRSYLAKGCYRLPRGIFFWALRSHQVGGKIWQSRVRAPTELNSGRVTGVDNLSVKPVPTGSPSRRLQVLVILTVVPTGLSTDGGPCNPTSRPLLLHPPGRIKYDPFKSWGIT